MSLSEKAIRDLERGSKLWVPVNPNVDYSNLKGIVTRKDSSGFTNDVEGDDSLN